MKSKKDIRKTKTDHLFDDSPGPRAKKARGNKKKKKNFKQEYLEEIEELGDIDYPLTDNSYLDEEDEGE